MNKSTRLMTAGIVGVTFMLAILIIAFVEPCPTESQYRIYKIIISISVGAFASIIPGLFEFKFNGIISASGAIAVFAFVFLYDPAQLIVSAECKDLSLSGAIYINNKETKNVDVRVGQLKKSDVTDEYGTFKIEYPKKEHKPIFNFRVTYTTSLDTSFEVTNSDWNNLKFYFKVSKDVIAFNPKSISDKLPQVNIHPQTPKREIKNYFEGTLPESSTAIYGGHPYCKYSMTYTDIKVQVKLTRDRVNVESAKVTFKAIEKALDNCPYPTGPPNTHIYDFENAQVSGNDIFISFIPDYSNNPRCSMTLTGIIDNEKIIASIYNDRIDMAEPKLIYKMKMNVQLEMTE